jgi:hypothetical protein
MKRKSATIIVLLAIGDWLFAMLGSPPVAPAIFAQGGCAVLAATPPLVAPAALLSPSGKISLAYADNLGGDTNAVASFYHGQIVFFSRGADLFFYVPVFAVSLPLSIHHLPDLIRDIAVDGKTLYVAAGAGGLQIIPDAPSFGPVQGVIRPPGLTAAVVVAGQRAYLASAGPGGGLQVVDVADPARPQLLGSAATYGSATAISVDSGLAYVAEGLGGGIQIFDLSNPRAPTLRGGLITPGAARGVAISGGRAYVAAGTCGLQVLDVADPARPRLLGAVATGGDAQAIKISAGRAYVAAGTAGLRVFDLSGDLPQPVAGRSFGALEPISNLAFDGDLVALAAGATGTIIVESSAPTLPLFGSTDTISGVRAARASGNDVYVALGDRGVAAVMTELSQTQHLDRRSNFTTLALNLALGPPVAGSPTLYAASGAAGIAVIPVAPFGPLTALRTVALPGVTGAILVDGATAYAAAGSAGVHILSLADPLSPTLQATVATPGAALDLALDGGLLYVADSSGMRVIDPATKRLVGGYDPPAATFVQGVAVSGARAYLASSSGLIVLDVSNPAKPTLLPGATGFSAYGLVLRGTQLFVAAGKDGVLAFDLTGTSGPRLAGTYDTPGTALSLTLDGDTLLVADSEGGLLRLNVIALPFQVWMPQVLR